MKKYMGLSIVVGILASMSSASAAEKPLFSLKSFTKYKLRLVRAPSLLSVPSAFEQKPTPPPAPAEEGSAPSPLPAPHAMGHDAAVQLFPCVVYEDLHNVHPCAVPKIVAVKDPSQCRRPCDCCEPGCVYVKICVPPCGCLKVKCSRNGNKVKYDYGKYEVEIKSKNGTVYVDYDD